jgi:hypothetical protein
MPNGGLTGRRLQGFARSLQGFGDSGCFTYLKTYPYDCEDELLFYNNSQRNKVCVYDDIIYYVKNVAGSNFSGTPAGDLIVRFRDVDDIVSADSLFINIGDPDALLPTATYPTLIGTHEAYSVARNIALDENGIYVCSLQVTSGPPTGSHYYVQFSTYDFDGVIVGNSGQTNYDAYLSDSERIPWSMAAYGGSLYTVSKLGTVYVYDFTTLNEEDNWTVTSGSTSDQHHVSVWDDRVYVAQTKSTGSSSGRYSKIYVYELDGTYVETLTILRHYTSGITTYGSIQSLVVADNVIYDNHGGKQQQHAIDGTFICQSDATTVNGLAGTSSFKYGGNIYLGNGNVISP